MNIVVGSTNPVKVNATREALNRVLGNINAEMVAGIHAPSLVADQPLTEAETRLGAVNRVKACMQTQQADWYVAIEGGVDKFDDGPATFAYVAICDGRQWSVGRSTNLPLPELVHNALLNGEELGTVMDRLFDTHNIKQKGGAIGLLTRDLATRQSVYELAIILAMAPFNYPDLYC